MAPGKVGLQQEVEVCRSRAEIRGGAGRVKREWRGFEIEETPNLVISKELPSWAVWRKGNCAEGRGEMKREEGRGSQPSPQCPLPACPSASLGSGLQAHSQGCKQGGSETGAPSFWLPEN